MGEDSTRAAPIAPLLIRMKPMLSWLVKSNLYVSSCAASLAYVTYVHALGLAPSTVWPPPAAVWLLFFATLFIYNLDRLSPAAIEDRHAPGEAPSLVGARETPRVRRVMSAMLVASLPGMAVSALCLPLELIALLAPLALIAMGYALPLIPTRGGWIRLKQVPGIKILLISLVWSIATVTLPGWEQGASPLSAPMLIELVARALFIFGITLPFDVRDMARDERAGIRTIPLFIGVNRTRWLAMASVAMMWSCEAARHLLFPDLPRVHGALVPITFTAIATLALLGRLTEERGERYHAIFMEGTMGLYAASVVLWRLWS